VGTPVCRGLFPAPGLKPGGRELHAWDRRNIGYSLPVPGLLGAGSRSAVLLRLSVIVEYGGLMS